MSSFESECCEVLETLRLILEKNKQGHILTEYFPTLTPNDLVFKELVKFDIPASLMRFEHAISANSSMDLNENAIEPAVSFDWQNASNEDKACLLNVGSEAIRSGSVAAIIMSGGQGTRLGFPGPKGMYPISPLAHKTIFQIHVERIMKIKKICACNSLPIYIMTSDLNDVSIRDFFAENNYFNYPANDIFFFEQGLELCITFDGKLIIDSENTLSKAPDGNGGIYSALKSSGAIEDMITRGVKHLHIYGIDNVLTKSVDPAFIGLCIQQDVQCGNKVVWRAHKGEKVGVTVNNNGKIKIIEYSEIPAKFADAEDPSTGRLIYGAANICNHYLRLSFLTDVVLPQLSGNYHIAEKKIPFMDPVSRDIVHPTKNNGMKLEMFIFDVFPLAGERWLVMEVSRQEEFAPVKNEVGSAQDSPDTARNMMTDQAIRWLTAAGATCVDAAGNTVISNASGLHCEISPLLSYGGEGLEIYSGTHIILPAFLEDPKSD